MTMKMFSEVINIWIGGLSKVDFSSLEWVIQSVASSPMASSSPWRAGEYENVEKE